MDFATLQLTIGSDGKVTACLVALHGNAPYDLAVIADDLADALNGGGLDGLRLRLGEIERELRERPSR